MPRRAATGTSMRIGSGDARAAIRVSDKVFGSRGRVAATPRPWASAIRSIPGRFSAVSMTSEKRSTPNTVLRLPDAEGAKVFDHGVDGGFERGGGAAHLAEQQTALDAGEHRQS